MKNIKFFAAALAATVAFSACSNEESGNTPTNGTTSVKIAFSYPDTPNTRAEGDATTVGEAEFKPGHILFVSGSGMIDTHVTIKTTGGDFTIDELEAGEVVVEDVSSSATTCYILSNDAVVLTGPAAISGSLEGTNISQVLAKQIPVGAMNDSPSTIENVPMYGTGTVEVLEGTTEGDKEYTASVNVEINSLASRIQIGAFTAEDYTPAGSTDEVAITSFTVEGIYINNTYDKMTFASVVAEAPEIDNGSVVDNYSKTVGTTDYIAAGTASTLADEPAAAAENTPLAAAPATADYWAYNVFPKGLPHVIVKLSNVKYTINDGDEQTIAGNQWLTIDSYKKTSGDTELTAFEANNIYTLSNVLFAFDDLTDTPYTTTLDVLVEVEMFDWVETPIYWNNN